ncbi:MAG: DUF4845 domain-containing protein [Methylococcales bacterium]|nr:DUF4845 domain-containing protein [Methylococcales bacterium]
MHNHSRQYGLTVVSFVLLMIFIGSVALLILKILPIYLDHSKIVSAFEAVESTENLEQKTAREIRTMFDNHFNINYVDRIKASDIDIIKTDNQHIKIVLDYEVIEEIAGNLSVLVQFHEQIEQGKP